MIIVPSILQYPIKSGDKFLICSDGLTDMLSLDEIRDEIADNDARTAVSWLCNGANQAGGKDNITIIVCEVKDGEEISAAPTVNDRSLTGTDEGQIKISSKNITYYSFIGSWVDDWICCWKDNSKSC